MFVDKIIMYLLSDDLFIHIFKDKTRISGHSPVEDKLNYLMSYKNICLLIFVLPFMDHTDTLSDERAMKL